MKFCEGVHSRRTLIIIGIVVVIVIVAAGGYFYMQQQNAAKAAVATRQTATLTRGELDASVESAGNITAPVQRTDFPSAGGDFTEVNVKPGAKVKKGDVLAKIDAIDLQTQVDVAQTLVSAQAKLDSLKNPPDNAQNVAISQATVNSAQASYDSAVAKLKALQAPPDPMELSADRAAVTSAQAAYDAAVKKNSMSNDQIVVARAALKASRIALQAAQRDYDAVAYDPRVSHSTQSDALRKRRPSTTSRRNQPTTSHSPTSTIPRSSPLLPVWLRHEIPWSR